MIKFIRTTRLIKKESEELRKLATELSNYINLSNNREEFLNQLIDVLRIVLKYANNDIITTNQSLCEYFQKQYVAGKKVNLICKDFLKLVKYTDKNICISEVSENTVYIGFHYMCIPKNIKTWKENTKELEKIIDVELRPLLISVVEDIIYYSNYFKYF